MAQALCPGGREVTLLSFSQLSSHSCQWPAGPFSFLEPAGSCLTSAGLIQSSASFLTRPFRASLLVTPGRETCGASSMATAASSWHHLSARFPYGACVSAPDAAWLRLSRRRGWSELLPRASPLRVTTFPRSPVSVQLPLWPSQTLRASRASLGSLPAPQHTRSGFFPSSLLGCGLSYLSKGLNRRLLPQGQKALLSSRMDGGPGTFSRLWVLQIPGLLLDGGSLTLCKWLWASPPPLSWAPLAGNRRPILTLTAILSVSTWTRRQWVAPKKIPLAFPQCEGEEARSYTPPESHGGNLKNSPCKGEQGSQIQNPLGSPFRQGSFRTPRTPLSPTAAFGPCPSLPPASLSPQPRVSCSQAGQDGQPEVSKL